ncbi:Glycosyl transferase family 2 [Prevotella communis]|uniref:Glycosyl transferase family 2 n=1 Tax=Prevotella communis TaxID=2913614 RepID=A0A1G7VUG0_9BACT|nr:glycosyltransferase family 2 protein [Prevotella communis]SDG63039.1 Glycosyl transferase family 2 [Prevotella communis]
MAQVDFRPILSLCIPIYNRLAYLEKQLQRLIEDRDLFENKIQLIISDNCSTDDLKSCCNRYEKQGLNLIYHRNETNLGPDGNFDWCFKNSGGKYIWLLGSDDIPVKGFIRYFVEQLEKGEYGLIHLAMKQIEKEPEVCHTSDDMAVNVNCWFTFMSANIIRADSLRNIDLTPYLGSFMIQVPAYINACYSNDTNLLVYKKQYFEKGSDAANNGGYNLFEVFVTNLYGIYMSFVRNGTMAKRTFIQIIKIEYRDFLLDIIVKHMIKHQKSGFSVEGGWTRLIEYYAFKPYAYFYLLKRLI